MKTKLLAVALLALLALPATCWAALSVPTLFSNDAVLQRDMFVPVWGTASPNQLVTVEFVGPPKTTTSDSSGYWMVELEPMDASSSPSPMVITAGAETITIERVQVGEVWVGSGQSNMQRDLSGDCDATAAAADAANHNLRFFNVTANGGNVDGTVWQVSDASSALDMSAVHFFFGRHLAQNLSGVPIGLITSAVGATAIERWATCAGSGSLYTGQVAPLQPYAIRGATWYQGEWDARGAQDSSKYYWQLPCLIDEWRSDWGQGAFPFYVVQMPKMGINSIHIVRDAELQTALADPQVEMIVTIDQPGNDVHPQCKDPFGARLAKLALEHEYGQTLHSRSPFYNAAASSVAGDTINVVFDHVAEGLASSGGALAEWEIADASGNFVAADAVIVDKTPKDTVVVSSPSVSNPTSARYAYSVNPAANNLVNSVGLPASPIREVTPTGSGTVCGDLTCDEDEDECSCPGDCGSSPDTETFCSDGFDDDCDGDIDCDDWDCLGDTACPYCGDAICAPGEDCNSCGDDCAGVTKGKPGDRYCCGNGILEGPEDDALCDGNP